MIGPEHEVEPAKCPACGYVLDAASNVDGATAGPAPGDLTVCIGCGTILAFTESMQMVVLEQLDLDRVQETDPDTFATVQKVRVAVLAMRRGRRA